MSDVTLTYIVTVAMAIGLGILWDDYGWKQWTGVAFVTAGVLILTAGNAPAAPIAIPLYVIVLILTALVSTEMKLRDAEMLRGEPYWRRLLMIARYGKAIRATSSEDALR